MSPLTVIEGGLITLVCESSGIPPPSLTWKRDSKTFHPHHPPHHYPQNLTIILKLNHYFILTSFIIILCVCVSGSELKGDSRVRVLSGGRQLQISSVRKEDASSYTCLASSTAGSAMKEYNLQVYGTCFFSHIIHYRHSN